MAVHAPIGLLGGSFNPIHLGHLQLARDARDRLQLGELRFIPAAVPWQKGNIVDPEARAQMVALAIAGEAGWVLDRIEIERGGASYTIDTLQALRTARGPEVPLVWILGSDQMARLDTWHQWQRLLDFAHLAVARRNDEVMVLPDALQTYYNAHWAEPAVLNEATHGHIVDLPMTPSDASGTEIRALLAAPSSPAREKRLHDLLPPAVLDYIRAHHLYA